MSNRKKNELKIGYKELQNGCNIGESVLDLKNTPIPIESLKVLMTGDSNAKFRILSKKINSENVKLVLKHRETKEQVKIVAPIQFLEFHKIPYKNPTIPTNKQIEGVLQSKVKAWECEIIIKDFAPQFDLVILLDKDSQKKIACKVPVQDIENTPLYIDKCQTYKQAINYDYSKINLWRENEWQREIMTKLNLLRLTRSTTQKKV